MCTFEWKTFQNDNLGLRNSSRRFSSIFPRYLAVFLRFPGLSLLVNPILSPDLNSSSNFTPIIVIWILFLFCIVEETQNAKVSVKTLFCVIWDTKELSAFINLYNHLNHFQNTKNHEKFSEGFESFIRVGLRVLALRKNC